MTPTLWFETALLPTGWADRVRVTHQHGRIAGVESRTERQTGEAGAAVGLPGMPNLHSHAFQRAMAGFTETSNPHAPASGDDDFWSWREAMYRFAALMGPDDLSAVAAMAFVEMLESGFTRVGEFHYLHHDRAGRPFANVAEMGRALAQAAAETGIGLTLLPVFYAHSGFGGAPPTARQRRFVTDPDSYATLLEASRRAVADLPDAVVGVAPHSLRAATPEQLARIAPLAGDGPVHIHIAEQVREVDDCLAALGARPVDWLLDHAPVGERWCLIHATHMTSIETGRLAASGAVAGLCPITEANLGDGLFPARAYLAAGGRLGVGSDSNVRIDAAEELRWLEYGQRLVERKRNRLATADRPSVGATLFTRAVAGGAQALGVAGEIAPGAPADIVGLDADHPSLGGRRGDALLDAFVFAAGREAIVRVWRAGEEMVTDGRHRHRQAVRARFRQSLERLLA